MLLELIQMLTKIENRAMAVRIVLIENTELVKS
jgi:hypothetical protein